MKLPFFCSLTIFLTAMAPAFALESRDILPTKIINGRTNETIAEECLKRQENQCVQFRYLEIAEDGSITELSRELDMATIKESLAVKRKYPHEDKRDIFRSDRLFVASESSDSAFSLLHDGSVLDRGGMTVTAVKQMYKRGKHEPNAAYIMHAAAATVATAGIVPVGVLSTGVLLAVDVVLLPVRGIGKLLSSPHQIRGKTRTGLKRANKLQDQVLSGNENIVIKTAAWKSIRDGLESL